MGVISNGSDEGEAAPHLTPIFTQMALNEPGQRTLGRAEQREDAENDRLSRKPVVSHDLVCYNTFVPIFAILGQCSGDRIALIVKE